MLQKMLCKEKALVLKLQEGNSKDYLRPLARRRGDEPTRASTYRCQKGQVKIRRNSGPKLEIEQLKKDSEIKNDGIADDLDEKIKLLVKQVEESKVREAELKTDVQNRQKTEVKLQEIIAELEDAIKGLKSQTIVSRTNLKTKRKSIMQISNAPARMKIRLGNKFGPFIKLKRENAILKAQIKDLMLTQKENAWWGKAG